MIKYSIAVTTYDYRFETYLIKLIDSIRLFRPNIEIIIAINGNYKEKFNEQYRKEILKYCSKIDHVFPIMFPTFRGLSKLWNTCLVHSSTNNVLVLNDDVSITSDVFFTELEKYSTLNIFKINGSWSHYYADRQIINEVGWFDERLLGIGEEDGDFEFRFGSKYNKSFPNINLPDIVNHVEYSGACKNMNVIFGKYSAFNRKFMLENKYEVNMDIGKKHGITNEYLVCKNPTPQQYTSEIFFWDNGELL